jgi:hypothetical protein
VGTYTGEILVFAVTPSFAHVATISAHTNAVKSLAVGGGALFSACANTTLAWHDLEDLTETRRQPKAHTRIANAACVLAAGGPAGFATVGRDRMLRLWLPEGESAHLTPIPIRSNALPPALAGAGSPRAAMAVRWPCSTAWR